MGNHFCTGCGAPLVGSARFCSACGTAAPTETPPDAPASPESSAPVGPSLDKVPSASASSAPPPDPPPGSGYPPAPGPVPPGSGPPAPPPWSGPVPPGSGPPGPPRWPAPPVPGGGPVARSSRPVGLVIAVALLATALLATLGGIATWQVVSRLGDDDLGDEIALEAVGAEVPDPFTASVAAASERALTPDAPPAGTAGTTTSAPAGGAGGVRLAGTAPGLYGGTRDDASCDPDQLVRHLEGNPAQARAWAGVLGIETSSIRSYVDGLTPVVLTRDTAVINHGYVNGRATPRPAVLQAGTAVLVDDQGAPRVKCSCGNPLVPPRAPTTATTYHGSRWSGFRPETVVTVDVSVSVDVFVLVNLGGGVPFGRPPGTTGDEDESIDLAEHCRAHPDAEICTTGPDGPGTTDPDAPASPPLTTPDGVQLGQGDVQVTLQWSTDADLDLHVTDPTGFGISFAQPRSDSGGELDVDKIPRTGDSGPHVENVFWPTGGAPGGSYTATVHNLGGSEAADAFTLDVFVNGVRVAGTAGVLESYSQSETVSFSF
jgi:hypothetical protein